MEDLFIFQPHPVKRPWVKYLKESSAEEVLQRKQQSLSTKSTQTFRKNGWNNTFCQINVDQFGLFFKKNFCNKQNP